MRLTAGIIYKAPGDVLIWDRAEQQEGEKPEDIAKHLCSRLTLGTLMVINKELCHEDILDEVL